MKKASSLLLSLVVFITSAPREGFTQVVQSVSFMGSGIAPFVLEPHITTPVISVRGDLAGSRESQTPENTSPYSDYRLKWKNISPETELRTLIWEAKETETPSEPQSWKPRVPNSYSYSAIGDFDANLHRLVNAERTRGIRMMNQVGNYGLTLRSLFTTSPAQVEPWGNPSIVAERREEELTGTGAAIEGITKIETGRTVIHSAGTASAYNAAADNRVESVDVTTEFFGILKNRIQVAQDLGSRLMRVSSADSSYGTALFILNEAKFTTRLGETRFNLNYERYEPGYFAPLRPQVLTDSHGFSASMTHKFNDKVKAGVSIKGRRENVHTDKPFSIDSATPGMSLTLRPFAESKHELLKNFQMTASAEHRKRLSSHGRINDRYDTAYLTFQNQYKRLGLVYQYGRSRAEYPRFDFVRREERHRIRLDYDLQFKDLDVKPFVSFEMIAPEKGTPQEEIRAGVDFGKSFMKRYHLRSQLYGGVVRQAGLKGYGHDTWPVMGMDLTLTMAPDCYLVGSLMMTTPYYGTTHPAAMGDVKFTMKF